MLQRSLALKRFLILVLSASIITGSFVEFERIAWGTGVWLGQFALKWAIALFLFGLFCILCLVTIWMTLWSPQRLSRAFQLLVSYRDRLGWVRWVVAIFFLTLPVYFLQYTFWGKVLHGPYLRVFIASLSSIFLASILTKDGKKIISWSSVLAALVLTAGTYSLFVALISVTSYPFSLGWSEGNRLWDYSVLFGRHVYDYPLDKPIPVLLETGRQFVGGIPFLMPDVNIWQVRLWLALVDILPYLILGWAAYRLNRKNIWPWILAGVWAYTFVHQGPVHPPLVLCAIVVALVWERPLWIAVPLIAVTSLFAETTRFTWMFAPGLWAAMLEFAGPTLKNAQPGKRDWMRAISVGLAGVFGGYMAPFGMPALLQWVQSTSAAPVSPSPTPSVTTLEPVIDSGVTASGVTATLSNQPLLWSRLLPNATYGEGILVGLALAVLPLIAVLVYFAATLRWKLNIWQKLAIILPLSAFLFVGMVASVKIGGGGDLHNMDMFIIGLMFAGAVAWRSGAFKWIDEIQAAPFWVQCAVLLMIMVPGFRSLVLMNPIHINEDLATVATLADIVEDPLPNPLPDTLPSETDTIKALDRIRQEVTQATRIGEVLFMDQRQLLTFGYVTDVPLVPEYDKKMLINEALSSNAQYFEGFYQDLASQRFSLIITNPVNRRLNKTEGHFGEENNAWVKWVSTPLLCYYEPLDRLKRVDVELLVPRTDISGCDQILPTNAAP